MLGTLKNIVYVILATNSLEHVVTTRGVLLTTGVRLPQIGSFVVFFLSFDQSAHTIWITELLRASYTSSNNHNKKKPLQPPKEWTPKWQ